jgi:hypothetical protein
MVSYKKSSSADVGHRNSIAIGRLADSGISYLYESVSEINGKRALYFRAGAREV